MRNHGNGIFDSSLMPGSLARPMMAGMGTGFGAVGCCGCPTACDGYSGYGFYGYGADEPAPAPPPADGVVPAKYVAYGALGIAGLALLISLARG